MRPIVFSSPADAIPYTSVPNSRGPTIDLISRRKMLLIGERFFEKSGKKMPSRTPRTSAMKIHEVRDSFFRKRTRSTLSPFQLLSKDVEKQHLGRPNQLDGFGRGMANNAIASGQRFSDLPINCKKRSAFAVVENANDARVGHDDRSIGEHVRADRCNTECGNLRKDDRSTGGQ